MKEDYGYVEYKGIKLKLNQQPYLDTKVLYEDIYNGYFSIATDEENNDYQIFWEITNDECEDESCACDWSKFEVRKL